MESYDQSDELIREGEELRMKESGKGSDEEGEGR